MSMSAKVRRAAGAALIVTACAAAASGFLLGGDGGDPTGSPAARYAIDVARRRVEQAWRAQRIALEGRAMAVAAIPPLQAALNAHVDGHTLVDLFDTEEWWSPVREDFRSVRIIIEGQVVAVQGKVDLGDADRELAEAAMKSQVASAVLTVKNKSFFAAATRIPAQRNPSSILVLANPLDVGVIQSLAERTGQAVMLSDAGASIAFAGTDEQRILIQSLVGRETQPAIVDPHGRWVAAMVTLMPNLRVWTVQSAAIEGIPSRTRGLVAWVLAPLFLAVGILLLVSRRAGGAVPAVVQKETTLKFGAALHSPRTIENPLRQVLASSKGSKPQTAAAAGSGSGSPGNATKVFGRYQLLDQLGQGGMADIYTAVASGVEGFTRTFVLKRLRPELARDKEAVRQFIDEARMQAGLVHSNIVPVFDFGVVDGEYFMTQEYIVGRDMVRVIQRYYEHTRRSMEPRFAYFVAHETLLALEYAHGKRDRDGTPMGIVHRDVSAANIMMSLEGEVKLFDFGIVKARGRSTQTQAGMVKGNTSFMSPEQARGQQVDGRSDLFSLALVMYYCLTGRLLYEGDNDLDVLYKAASGPTAADWEAIDKLPSPVPEILSRALAIDPARRFQSAAEFAQALAPHIHGVKSDAANLMQLLFGDELRREAA
jgi:hypothetical protein